MTEDRSDDIAIGTDIVEIQRFRDLDSESAFFNRVFTDSEREYCRGYSDPAPHLAATFAGKEAVVKATSSSCTLSMNKIEILREENGAPFVTLHQECPLTIRISLSHSSTHAVAVAVAFVQSIPDQKHIQGILDDSIQELLPGGEM
ncbi:MAG: holo-ACP synthase [Candidatus Thorarchaeota archaeon]